MILQALARNRPLLVHEHGSLLKEPTQSMQRINKTSRGLNVSIKSMLLKPQTFVPTIGRESWNLQGYKQRRSRKRQLNDLPVFGIDHLRYFVELGELADCGKFQNQHPQTPTMAV